MNPLRMLILAAALLLVSCDDDTTAPEDTRVPISDFAPRLVIEPTEGPIGTFFEVTVEFDGGTPDDLGDYGLRVSWPTRFATGMRIPADEVFRLQIDAVGSYEVSASITPPAGVDEQSVSLRVPVTVAGGSDDGSLDMISVPTGSFLQGNTEKKAFYGYSPQRTVQMSSYSIARTEVTNAAFVETLEWAIEEGRAEIFGYVILSFDGPIGIVVAEIEYAAFSAFNDPEPTIVIDAGHELHPARGISWKGAAVWCNWQSERDGLEPVYTHTTIDMPVNDISGLEPDYTKNGYRLPTHAEWEKAARGGEMLASGPNPMPSRWYPWGDEPYYEVLSGGRGFRANLWGYLGQRTTPVGSFPDSRSPYGLDDMIGNVSEWVNDWYDRDYYEYAPDQDPRGPETFGIGDEFLAKTWCSSPAFDGFLWLETGCSVRIKENFTYSGTSMGFRVARSE